MGHDGRDGGSARPVASEQTFPGGRSRSSEHDTHGGWAHAKGLNLGCVVSLPNPSRETVFLIKPGSKLGFGQGMEEISRKRVQARPVWLSG